MTTKKKEWRYSPPLSQKQQKTQIPDTLKIKLEKLANDVINTHLKPEYLTPTPKELSSNDMIDIYTKWHQNKFYFCVKYQAPSHATMSSSENKFARMVYVGENMFELSYCRHSNKWFSPDTKSMEDCMKCISTAIVY